jgi:hypothetical protein
MLPRPVCEVARNRTASMFSTRSAAGFSSGSLTAHMLFNQAFG